MLDDYFPDSWLLIVDESHVTCIAVAGDVQRRPGPSKKVLIDHGFRCPVQFLSLLPLKGEEFWTKARQTVLNSATPGYG